METYFTWSTLLHMSFLDICKKVFYVTFFVVILKTKYFFKKLVSGLRRTFLFTVKSRWKVCGGERRGEG